MKLLWRAAVGPQALGLTPMLYTARLVKYLDTDRVDILLALYVSTVDLK